ncbi:type II CAAX endopeptidase family protein [Paraclostridium sordellii]|uniref:CPBP family intramembrane glutamic endopeptidase n=1 Tax=Paraclostridium sordellii TaxID=1505 RepID=UPI0005E255C6|nr:type II CAAX endopeptidase family protein [Paeniclostridium sordellii]CEP80428.1 CAAX amino terminal protease family protein [[Clostridium] sordellii] [Paeniclostridium sordellii]
MKKSKALILSIGVFTSWWIIIYVSLYLGANLNLFMNGIGGEGEIFYLYYYLLAVAITIIIYFFIVPLFIKNKENRKKYIDYFKLNINKHSTTYILIVVIGAVLGYIIFGNLYGRSTFGYIYAIQPPIVEELLFRGLILSILSYSFPKKYAIIISSILFGLIHSMISPINVIVTIFIGIIYCIIVFRTKSILPTMAIHYVQSTNLYQFAFVVTGIIIFEFIFFLKKRKSI